MEKIKEWDLEIKSSYKWYEIDTTGLWKYRDLILLFVRRDFVSQYKQTILGPLWHIIQPILNTFVFTIVFSYFAHIPTGDVPAPLFYLSGIVVWNFFVGCLLSTANTFVANSGIFGKIYFPRLVIPISVVLSTSIRFGIQLLLFLFSLLFYILFKNLPINVNAGAALIPILLLIMGIMGMGFGIIISSVSTKYRDISLFLGFGVQILMYLTPIIYRPEFFGKFEWVINLNPMTPVIQTFRYGMMNDGILDLSGIAYSTLFSIVIFFIGVVMFNKTEKNFMDTV